MALLNIQKDKDERNLLKLRQYILWKIRLLIAIKILAGRGFKLVVDGTIFSVANTSRAETQKIKRFTGKVFGQRDAGIYTVFTIKYSLV